MLFCLILIKKYGFCLQIIKEKIDEHLNGSKELSQIVYQVIVDLQLYCESFFQENYEFFKEIDLVFDNKLFPQLKLKKTRRIKVQALFLDVKTLQKIFIMALRLINQ